MSDYHIRKFEYKGHILEIKTPNTGFEYNPNPVFNAEYKLGDSEIFYAGAYHPREIEERFRVWIDKYEKQVMYGSEMLAQDLFLETRLTGRVNSMLLYYPEALPEVIELLDRLHSRYRGRIK